MPPNRGVARMPIHKTQLTFFWRAITSIWKSKTVGIRGPKCMGIHDALRRKHPRRMADLDRLSLWFSNSRDGLATRLAEAQVQRRHHEQVEQG